MHVKSRSVCHLSLCCHTFLSRICYPYEGKTKTYFCSFHELMSNWRNHEDKWSSDCMYCVVPRKSGECKAGLLSAPRGWCFLACDCMLPLLLKDFGHWGHRNGRSPVWLRTCTSKFTLWLKIFPQKSQVNVVLGNIPPVLWCALWLEFLRQFIWKAHGKGSLYSYFGLLLDKGVVFRKLAKIKCAPLVGPQSKISSQN